MTVIHKLCGVAVSPGLQARATSLVAGSASGLAARHVPWAGCGSQAAAAWLPARTVHGGLRSTCQDGPKGFAKGALGLRLGFMNGCLAP